MNQLQETTRKILELRNTIIQYEEDLRRSEAQTRASLVEPMLRVLGWDVGNPADVASEAVTEFDGRVRFDYLLMDYRSEEVKMIVEVKSLQRNLLDARTQVIEYCKGEEVDTAVVTDGNDWILYDLSWDKEDDFNDGDFDEFEDEELNEEPESTVTEIARFSVYEGDAVVNAIMAQQFANRARIPMHELSQHRTTIARAFGGMGLSVSPTESTEAPQLTEPQVHTLEELKDMQMPPPPFSLRFPDGYTLMLPEAEWADWVVQVAVYLYVWAHEYRYMDHDDYHEEYDNWPPQVFFHGSRRRCVVNDEAEHEDGEDFEYPLQIRSDVWLELEFDGRSEIKTICRMLEEREIDPDEVAALVE